MRKRDRSGRTSFGQFADGRDENNLAEFPIALLSDAAPAGQRTIEFSDTLDDWRTKQVITRRVSITGSDKFGLPTAKDEEVLLALLQLTKIANNFTSPEVWFVKRDVIEILGWRNRGWAYDRVEEALHRWKGVSIHYWNAWRDKATGTWCDSAAIGVIDYFTLADGRRRRALSDKEGRSRFSWNKLFFESFEAGYLKKLDFEMYRRLRRPGAKRALRFLDKRFYHKPVWEFDLRVFACEKLGFSRAYSTGQLKECLRPVLGELEEIGYIEPVEFHKQRPKHWNILIARKPSDEPAAADSAPPASGESQVSCLIQRGITASSAQDLVEKYPADRIQTQLQLFDWLVRRNDRRISKNPPGWLASAIRKDYPLPRDYLRSTGERRRSQPAARSEVAALPHVKPSERKAAPIDPEQRAIDAYLASLGEEELAQLEAAALARADRVLARGYERSKAAGGQVFAAYRRMLQEREARRMQESNSPTTQTTAAQNHARRNQSE